MPITIDIRTRTYAPAQTSFRLFPGQGYRFFDLMRQYNVVFLDAPFMTLPPPGGYVQDEPTAGRIASALRLSKMNPGLLGEAVPVQQETTQVMRDIDLSLRVPWSKNRRQMLQWLNGLHRDTNIDDIIVVPSPGYSRSDDGERIEIESLIGRIIGTNRQWDVPHTSRFYPRRYVVRDVEWVSTINELELNKKTILSLRTPNALVPLRANEIRHVLASAYKNVMIGDQYSSRFSTTAPRFNTAQNFHFQAFCMVAAAALSDIPGADHLFSEDKSIYEIAASLSGLDWNSPEQISNIRSPGFMDFLTRNSVAIGMAVLFSVAFTFGPDALVDGQIYENVINSVSEGEETLLRAVGETLATAQQKLHYRQWQELTQAVNLASEYGGVYPYVSVAER